MNRRLVLSSLIGLAVGMGGETLLFLQRQARLVEESLREDFRVLLYARTDLDEGKQKVLEEKLRALPDVEDVRAVSPDEQLAALRRDDPELVESLLLVGDNPLTPAFEVRLTEAGVPRVAQWLAQAQPLGDWTDVRYKPAQVQAILQAQFYTRFLDLALSALVCLAAALGLAGLWTVRGGARRLSRDGAGPLTAAAGAAAVGAAAVCLMVLPMKALSPAWEWPPAGAQAALLAAASASGWVLCARQD